MLDEPSNEDADGDHENVGESLSYGMGHFPGFCHADRTSTRSVSLSFRLVLGRALVGDFSAEPLQKLWRLDIDTRYIRQPFADALPQMYRANFKD